MKGTTLTLAALLLAPLSGALPLLASEPPAPAAPPSRCEPDHGGFVCSWNWTSNEEVARAIDERTFPIPVLPLTLATITVVLRGDDEGWEIRIEAERAPPPSKATHQRDAEPAYAHYQSTAHVLAPPPNAPPYRLSFVPRACENCPARSLGAFQLTYQAEPLAEGTPPARPAASGDFPQVTSPQRDAPPQLDLVAAWLDDAALGDGLFDAHLRVAGDLTTLEFNESNFQGMPAGVVPSHEIHWEIRFAVGGSDYAMRWKVTRDPFSRTCELLRLHPPPVEAGPTEGSADEVIASPLCPYDPRDLANGTLHATIPERSVGSPGPGVPFTGIAADVNTINSGATYSKDKSGPASFGFALGGPAVWDGLNGCHYCAPPVPWYMDPLSAENLPNTVQVGGAAVAAGAFFVGLFLVRRRRAKVARLLHEVAAVEESHERDTRGALLALGALDSRFARMLHEGQLTESQYQVVAQRVATAATRFALRQGLGLDDGSAGDRQARTIPVEAR